MTPTPAGRSQSSRVKSFGSLEPNSSEMLNYSGWCGFLTWVLQFLQRRDAHRWQVSNFLSEQPAHKWGWGRLFIAAEQSHVKWHKCPSAKRQLCPPFGPLAGSVPATPHVTRGTVRILSLSLSSGKLHSQFPDSSTEDRFLSVLKNNVSDTRGTELLLQEISLFRRTALAVSRLLNRRQIPQCPEEQRLRHPRNWTSTAGDFSGIFFRFSYWAIPQNFGTHFPQPLQQCGVFLRLKKYEKHNEDYASTFASTWVASGWRRTSSGSTECLRIQIPQDFVPRHSSEKHLFLQCSQHFWGVDNGG